MDETTEDTTVNYQISLPSAKEQAASALIGVGVTLGAYALIAGGAAAYVAVRDKISVVRHKRRTKKIALLEAQQQKLEEKE